MLGDTVRDDDGRQYIVIWDGSRGCASLLGDRRELTADIYHYGFDISNRSPWERRKGRKGTEERE